MDAQVWLARSGSASEICLSPRERTRRNRFQQREDRDRFATGATLARYALRRLTFDERADVTRSCVECHALDHGPVRPVGRYDGEWSLSVSHSGGLVAVAAVPGPDLVGVDVETADLETIARVKEMLCRDDELVEDLLADDLHGALLTRWVRKEAVLKATQVGLTVPMRHLRMSPVDEPAELRDWNPTSRPVSLDLDHVACTDLPAAALAHAEPGSRGALAVVGAERITVRLHWVGDELRHTRASAGPTGMVGGRRVG